MMFAWKMEDMLRELFQISWSRNECNDEATIDDNATTRQHPEEELKVGRHHVVVVVVVVAGTPAATTNRNTDVMTRRVKMHRRQ